METIAVIYTEFDEKFGIPRQSGLVEELEGKIVFEKPFRCIDAVRGLEDFSHLWLIWGFSANETKPFSPTVRPPRLGGNTRVGVFASRSPFRPNGLGLSCVKIKRIDDSDTCAPVIYVSGADLMNGTPIYDIKPYVESDCHPEAAFGFTQKVAFKKMKVLLSKEQEAALGEKSIALKKLLENNPAPAYHTDSERIYGMHFAGKDIHFKVGEDTIEVLGIHDTK